MRLLLVSTFLCYFSVILFSAYLLITLLSLPVTHHTQFALAHVSVWVLPWETPCYKFLSFCFVLLLLGHKLSMVSSIFFPYVFFKRCY